MTVLLIAEINGTRLEADATAKALAAAARLGAVDILVAGEGVSTAANEAAGLAGVARVLVADHAVLGRQLAEPMAELIAGLAGRYTHVIGPATAGLKNILPRVAGRLDVMILSDVIGILDAETFERPIYAGNAIQTVRSADPIKVATIRTAAFAPAPRGGSAPIEAIEVAPAASAASHWVEDRLSVADRPELSSAGVVVSGGRGVGSKENFALIEQLADKLGAAVGASRAAVDAGYAPNDRQVGQTGKVVAPALYVAVGISGAIQHLAGMKDSKLIVAINKDEDAPIFAVADYGLVGDLFQAVPELVERL
ncbi:electron transfer flavoprotein alpha subunit [Angulomicrobium tetraedrale]|uniref:Electron transfer flavoprotein subunit alpha n=1 Tax=Ancylobacter tetraedralis TaxID=217068 RepID=A0A839Z185_9HYPH|nr:FAD-binding protein [Ancylobacter tetraedralis]MBB3770494.1 electron transfer flavoprotein alpha subunit [Ancylobacter tetraedralis]